MLTKEMVKNSMEAKWRKDQVKFWVVFILVMGIGTLVVGMFAGAQHGDYMLYLQIGGIMISLVYGVCFLPFVLFYLYKYFRLFRNLSHYDIYEVVLSQPRTSYWYRGAVYYAVSFKIRDGENITLDTKPLWSSSMFASFRLEDYNNEKIKVAYNIDTEEMITLG